MPLGRIVLDRGLPPGERAGVGVAGRRPIDVAVNLSPRQFRDPGLLDTIQSALAAAGSPPRT